VLSLAAVQAIALPAHENPIAPKHVLSEASLRKIQAANEVIDTFRSDIELYFVRFQNFYDRTNAQMRDYRISHVHLITRVYNEVLRVFGESIEAHVEVANELTIEINEQVEAGGMTDCLQGVIDGQEDAAILVGAMYQACAASANVTFSDMLRDTFYPTFSTIQASTSTLPNSIIDVLSRGNVLQDERSIIEYLRLRYEVVNLQWTTAVSQLLTWETNRFTNEGLFKGDETLNCLADTLMQLILNYAQLHMRARECASS